MNLEGDKTEKLEEFLFVFGLVLPDRSFMVVS